MKGTYKVSVENNRLHYEFEIKQKITIIRGDSATGNTIFFIDNGNAFVNTEEFAEAVKKSNSYFVLITRENLHNLPYRVDEIYRLHCFGKYRDTRKMYNQLYRII